MKNLSNGESIKNWITTIDEKIESNTKTEAEETSVKQLTKDVMHLSSEINHIRDQLEKKLEMLQSIDPTKETYDNIVTVRAITSYNNHKENPDILFGRLQKR